MLFCRLCAVNNVEKFLAIANDAKHLIRLIEHVQINITKVCVSFASLTGMVSWIVRYL